MMAYNKHSRLPDLTALQSCASDCFVNYTGNFFPLYLHQK
jgi:hypothetical protein